jgi:hypothetical protein
MLKETRNVVEQAIKAGRSLDQMKHEKVLEAWRQWSGDFISSDAFIETLYNDRMGKKSGDFIEHN